MGVDSLAVERHSPAGILQENLRPPDEQPHTGPVGPVHDRRVVESVPVRVTGRLEAHGLSLIDEDSELIDIIQGCRSGLPPGAHVLSAG